MLAKESKTIGGVTYTATQFPAMRSFALLAKLVKTLGPVLGAMVGADPNADIATLGPKLAIGLKDVDPQTVSLLAVEVLSCVSALTTDAKGIDRMIVLDSQATIDNVFMGQLPVMFQVLAFALQVNYRDFTAGSFLTAP